MGALTIAAPSAEVRVMRLSGGNQQKVLLARWLAHESKVLILEEPTRGVDIATKAEIYRVLRQLADDGVAVLVISSDLEEVALVGDRVLVMRNGALVAELQGADETEIARAALAAEEVPAVARWTHVQRPETPPSAETAGQRTRPSGCAGSRARAWCWCCSSWWCSSPARASTSSRPRTSSPSDRWRSALGIMAVAQTFLIISGGFDLSVGSVVALTGVAIGVLFQNGAGLDIWLSALVGLSMGLLVGIVNGVIVVALRINALITTLGTLSIFSRTCLSAHSRQDAHHHQFVVPVPGVGVRRTGARLADHLRHRRWDRHLRGPLHRPRPLDLRHRR